MIRKYCRLFICCCTIFLLPEVLCAKAERSNEDFFPKGEEYTWDFGRVKEGDSVHHEFVLKNDADKSLNIRSVTASCGCTVAEVKKRSLLAGESCGMDVTFRSKGYSGDVTQFVYVHTDSLDNPILRFIIKAYVFKEGD